MSRLTEEEIRFFKREGYLAKRGVMDPDLMAQARDYLWEGAPSRMRRDDPETWVGPFRPDEEDEDPKNQRRGFTWKYREPVHKALLSEMLPTNPTILGWAEQLLGKGEVAHPPRVRGIYCKLPMGAHPEEPTVFHVDVLIPLTPRLGLIGLIAHIPPHGGGFTVWPKSHRAFYGALARPEVTQMVANSPSRRERVDGYKEAVAHFNKQPYVDCHGDAGDIFFWHHLLAHSAGYNRSEQIELRQAVLSDYVKEKAETSADEPPHEDIWHNWSDEVRGVSL